MWISFWRETSSIKVIPFVSYEVTDHMYVPWKYVPLAEEQPAL